MTQNTINNNTVLSDNEQELVPLLLLLWSKKFYIGAFLLVGLLIGTLSALQKTPVYRADALVQLEPKNGGMSLSQDIEDLMSSDSKLSAEIEIIKSRMVIGKSVENLSLDTKVTPLELPYLGKILFHLGVARPNWRWLDQYAWEGDSVAVDDFQIAKAYNGQPIILKVESPTTYTLALPDSRSIQGVLGQPLVDASIGLSIVVKALSAPPGAQFAVHKGSKLAAIKRIRSALQINEKGRGSNILSISMTHPDKVLGQQIVEDIVRTYVAQNLQRSSEQAEKSLLFLQQQVPLVLEELTTAEGRLNDYRLKNESINLDLEATATLNQIVALDTKLNELAIEESELSRLFTKEHPRYVALENKRRQIISRKETLETTVQSFPEVQQEILSRTRDVEVNQQIYLQLLSRQQELNVVKASVVGNVRVIDNALAQPGTVGPNRPRTALMWAFLGTLLGCAIVLARFFLTKNIDSPEEITELGLAVYSTVPEFKSKSARNRPSGHLVSRDNPAELAVEALRSLRTSLHFEMLQSGKGLVSVTGPAPAVGKTFVSTNLAFLAAEAGARVLLIDADMRRGTVGTALGLDKSHAGFAEFLTDRASVEQAVQTVGLTVRVNAGLESVIKEVQSEVTSREPELEAVLEGITMLDDNFEESSPQSLQGHGRLDVITRGNAPHNPAELLLQSKVPAFLERMQEDYDLVIVDTPPVLAATDPMIIGRYANTNLMVVRHNATALHEIKEVKRLYDINQLEISGVVLNCYDPKTGRYGGYGYTYGYQYSYESED